MAIASRENGSSTLNPNAPLFIPLAYQQVEDFSPEWWKLVQSSPWFRDYWLRERYEMFEEMECFADLFPENLEDEFSELEEELLLCSGVDDGEFFDGFDSEGTHHELDNDKEALVLKTMVNGKPSKSKYEVKLPEKAPQIVNVKCSPRRIQQPR